MSMAEYDNTDELKKFLSESKISNTRASQLLGIHRDTIQKWLKNHKIPLGTLEALRSIDLTHYQYNRDFALPLSFLNMTSDEFCKLTGIPITTLKAWKTEKFVPKWAVMFLKQRKVIKALQQKLAEKDLSLNPSSSSLANNPQKGTHKAAHDSEKSHP